MLILELALVAMLSTKGTAASAPAATADTPRPAMKAFPVVLDEAQLPRTIKKELEAISGPGSVDISVDHQTLYNVRISVPSFRAEIYNPIYDRALELYKLYPDLSFDFYLRLKSGSAPKR